MQQFASSHPDIAKRTSVSGLIFSCIMLLAGVIAFVSTFEMEDRFIDYQYGTYGTRHRLVLDWRFPVVLEIQGDCLLADGQCC